MVEIITLTNNTRPHLLAQATKSIELSLNFDDVHTIVECKSFDLVERLKFKLLHNSKQPYVCFVDDDDLLIPGVLQKCVALMKLHKPGVVFAEEECIAENGHKLNEGQCIRPKIPYRHLCHNPRAMHGLVLMNVEKTIKDLPEFGIGGGAGSEWAFKSSIALTHGAIHVPEIGYSWRIHSDQMHYIPAQSSCYMENKMGIVTYLTTLLKDKTLEYVPRLTIKENK
jgi:hypothetical protein